MGTATEAWEKVRSVTPEQVAFYRDQGYLKLGRIFSQAELNALREHVDGMIAALPPEKRPEEMDVPHFTDPWLFRYLSDPRVLDVIEDLIGPDIVLWSSHFIAKPRGNGRAVPWHTDGAYWGKVLQPMQVVTLWLAVDESTRENGCMRVIPGSHRHGRVYGHRKDSRPDLALDLVLEDGQLDPNSARDVVLEAGQFSLHDVYLVHGSNPNRSTRRRAGVAIRFMPATSLFDRALYKPQTRSDGHVVDFTNRPIWLVRGRDHVGNDFTVGH